ncbi:MAG TPA: PKD domain-containing protein, partial [Bacteroidales bacterium]|nr:PKD domain-containing protein [Bacteroidales bacterium]
MRNLILITALLFMSVSYGFSQSYDIVTNDGESVSTCSGTLTQGSYTVGETYTFTVCSDDPIDHHVTASLSQSFTTGTELCVYDGPDDTAPQLVCWDENTSGSVAAYASNTNSSGCLTFVFTAGASGATFSADFACQFICQAPMLVDIVSSEPAMVTEGSVDYINVCWDEENNQSNDVTLTAEGTYPDNTGYPLDDSNVTFTWNFNDGSPPQSGVGLTTVTHNFPNRQGYTVMVSIEDSQGCTNTNSMTQRIRVSRAPVWDDANTYVDPDAICMGEEVEMCAAYSSEEWNSSITPEVADTIDLPDGDGVCYNSPLMQNQFLPDQTLESANDLNAICMNMEHSFLGDLTIEIQCPNGQSVLLEEQAGGGTNLGEPIDESPDNSDPGVGYWYCITPNGTQTLAEAAGSYSTLPEGQYGSFESLSGLVGCPLNGQWTITICDNWSIDDGYIFGWYLDFDESL